MNRKSSALLLTLLLALAPSLFADEHGKRGKKDDHEGEDKVKIEKRVKIEDDEDRVKVERRDDEDRVRIERRVRVVPANRIVIINNDVNRLESILATAQGTNVVFAQPVLVRFGNEAFVLSNRIVVNTNALRRANAMNAARALRLHIRELRAAALRGDVVAVRLHAREALPFAIRIDSLM